MNPEKRSLRRLVVAAIHFSFAPLFGYAFYERFWAWRHEIAQVKTSFVTPDGGNVTSAGMLWIVPAFIFAALGVVRLFRYASPADRQPEST